jgi:hypothetical protein
VFGFGEVRYVKSGSEMGDRRGSSFADLFWGWCSATAHRAILSFSIRASSIAAVRGRRLMALFVVRRVFRVFLLR